MSHAKARTVSRAAALDLIDTCKSLSLLSASHVKVLGLVRSQRADISARIPESTLIALWKIIEQRCGEQGVGLKIGQTINPNAKGLLASWVSQSKNLREALTIFRNNILLMNPSESWEVKQGDAHIGLVLKIERDLGYPDIAIERSMSAMLTWARALCGQRFDIIRAEFSFAIPPYAEDFVSTFGNNICFNSAENSLFIHSDILNLQVLSSNPFLENILKEQASKKLSELQNKEPLKAKVEKILAKAIESGKPASVNEVSSALAISRQTLYRHLKQQNTDFQSLNEAIKRREAVRLLKQGLSVSTVSMSLGYEDESSFYKAFKRWFKISPKAYLRITE